MFKREKEIWSLKEKVSRQEEYIKELETIRDHYRITTREQRGIIDKQGKVIAKQNDLINEITKELYSNIKTDKQIVEKLKELVSDYQSLN